MNYQAAFDREELRAAIGAPALFADHSKTPDVDYLAHVHLALNPRGAQGWATDRYALCAAHAPAEDGYGIRNDSEISLALPDAAALVRFLGRKPPAAFGSLRNTVLLKLEDDHLSLGWANHNYPATVPARTFAPQEKRIDPRELIRRYTKNPAPAAKNTIAADYLARLDKAARLGAREDQNFTITTPNTPPTSPLVAASASGRIAALIMPVATTRDPVKTLTNILDPSATRSANAA